MFIVTCCTIKYEKLKSNCYQMNTELKHKEMFKLWTQRKGEHSNAQSKYFQNSDI